MKSDKIRSQLLILLQKIPKGKITTYKILAKKLNCSPRYIGYLLHQNSDPKKYPCHRVIKSDGTLASGYVFGGSMVLKMLLEKEGVIFRNNKISLGKYLYKL